MFGSQDITFCMENECKNVDCYRHKTKAGPGIHSYAFLRDTMYCPLSLEIRYGVKEEKDEKTVDILD